MLSSEPLRFLKSLSNLAYLNMYRTYQGEELHFEEGGFQRLKQLLLEELEGLKVLNIDKGALPLLENLELKSLQQMKEVPNFQHLTNLKSLTISNMPEEFEVGLEQDVGPHYWKIQHVPFLTIN